MAIWDDDEELKRFKKEMEEREPTFHMCSGWEADWSFYSNGEFFEIRGFGGDGGPIYNEDVPEMLNKAKFCLHCGVRVSPLEPEGPLLQEQQDELRF